MSDADSVSAFFIDTASRMDKRPFFEANLETGATKLFLLAATLSLTKFVLHGQKTELSAVTKAAALADSWRRHLCFGCAVVFIGRITVQMALFWHRRITWNEALAEAGFIIPVSLFSLAKGCVRRRGQLLGWREFVGLLVFAAGTWVNLSSEFHRYIWKLDPAHAGRLYTEGLWRWAQHVNYAGEIGSFFGWALFCDARLNLWVPLAMLVGMAGWSVPELDFYLAKRYPGEWAAYTAEVTWRMVPGVW